MKQSMFVTACGKCGSNITSPTTIGNCPHCGAAYEFHWQYSSGNVPTNESKPLPK